MTQGGMNVAMVLTGVAAGAVAWRRGWLRPRALAEAPGRDVQIELLDLALALLLMLAGMLAFTPVRRALGLFHGSDPAGLNGLSSMQTALLTLLGQGLTQLPLVIYFLVRLGLQPDGLRAGGVLPRRWRGDVGSGVVGFLLATPAVFLVTALTGAAAAKYGHPAPERLHEGLDRLVRAGPGAEALFLISFCLVAPLLEEAIYRGLVQTALLQALGPKRRWGIVLGAAGVFALIHAQNVDWVALPGLWVLGVALGWLYERRGSLLPCVVVHVLFNACNCALALRYQS
jgi:membrane protease YdiL (CAAX protease family)